MKKLLTTLTAGFLFAGVLATTAYAAEHEVEQGENLWEIANDYGMTVDEIVDINNLDTEVIQPNQVLMINPMYIVQRGDSLTSISEEYNVSVDDLMEWNDLHTSLIVIGQELKIQDAVVDESDTELSSKEQQPSEVTEENTSNQEKATEEKTETTEATKTQQSTQSEPEGNTISVSATAYTAGCDGCSGITYTGVDLNSNPNAKVIAVDPDVIPLGSEVYVEGYGYAVAADIGSAIQGNKIDVHVPTKDEAFNWGVQSVNVTVLD